MCEQHGPFLCFCIYYWLFTVSKSMLVIWISDMPYILFLLPISQQFIILASSRHFILVLDWAIIDLGISFYYPLNMNVSFISSEVEYTLYCVLYFRLQKLFLVGCVSKVLHEQQNNHRAIHSLERNIFTKI